MGLEILKHPNPTLFEPSHSVRELDDELQAFIVQMIATMKEHSALGLAAPQVGVLKKIVVMEVDGWQRVMINPEIKTYSDLTVQIEEGCLSCPEKQKVQRSLLVRVEYKNLKWERTRETLQGLPAIVAQHEIDHLSGITIVERAREIPPNPE